MIKESNYEEINKLDAGSWFGKKWKQERIPLLEDVLNFIPNDKELFIEVKTGPEIIEYLLKASFLFIPKS